MTYDPKTLIWDGRSRSKEFKGRQRILIVGPASPSTGGIPSYIDDLLESELKDQFLLGLLDSLVIKKRFYKQKSHFSLKEIKASFRVFKTFIKAVRNFDPELVHIHTSSYWGFYEKAVLLVIAKKIFKKKVILHIHGGEFDLFYLDSPWKNLINRIICLADRAQIVSKKIKETIGDTQMMVVENSTRFNTCALTVDKGKLRGKYAIPKDRTVFLSLAILEKRKCIYETLEVFESILACRDDFFFIIGGEGPEKQRIFQFVEKHNLSSNVKMYHYMDGQKKEDMFLLSDVFILNSTNESFGITLIEAVSHGLFVITTPVGIASDAENVFHAGNSIIVPINDNKVLRTAILTLLDKRIDIETITKENFWDFKLRYDVEPVFKKMNTIYEEVLGLRRGG